MEQFLDASYTVRVEGYDHSLTPLGDDINFIFNLGSDGQLRLEIEDFDAYSSSKISHLVIRGEWELMIFRPDRFAIRINHPEIKILLTAENEKKYVTAIQNRYLLWVSRDGAYFSPFPAYDSQQPEAPTLIESEADRSASIESAKPIGVSQSTEIKRASPQVEKPRLESPDQLPEIAGDGDLVFVWDQLEWDSVIRYGDFTVWREWTGFEVYDRFEEILIILKQKYGRRLIDVAPTLRSLYCLYGDRFQASGHVQDARQALLKNE
jgi:hypothetical protein